MTYSWIACRHGLVGALALAFAGAAFSAAPALSKEAVRAAEKKIEAQRKADDKVCAGLKGDPRDICKADAKAREKAERAELEARVKPSPEADREAKEARSDAEYKAARVRCGKLDGRARSQCVVQAKTDRDAAERLAKVEKVEDVSASKEQKVDGKKGGKPARVPPTPQERYAGEKARCEMQGPDRDACMADVKRRYNKT